MKRCSLTGVLLVLMLVLTGCGAMPTTGEVYAGELAREADPGDLTLLPNGPTAGSTPEQIVRDFIQAATSPANGWRIAQQFLAPGAKWAPDADVKVDNAERHYTVSEDGTSVEVDTEWDGSVDANGVYSEFAPEPLPLQYQLKKVGGEWRIAQAPAGILIERGLFSATVFQQYALMFFDPTYTFLVPDLRWFPQAGANQRIVNALIAGPSEQIAHSVVSAIPPGTSAKEGTTQVETGIAQVALSDAQPADATTLGRMQLQLSSSLGVRDIQMTVDGAAVTDPMATATSTDVDTQPVVLTDKAFGSLSGTDVTAIGSLYEGLAPLAPTAISLDRAGDRAIVRTVDGDVVQVTGKPDATLVLDDRPGLIAPTLDPFGYTWSVPHGQPGAVLIVDADAKRVDVRASLAGVGSVDAMQMSRDGTRLAATVVVGTQSQLGFFPVLRDGKGVPTGLGPFVSLLALPHAGSSVSWLDDSTIGALTGSGDQAMFVDQTIGGTAEEPIAVPSGSVTLVGGNSMSVARVVTTGGVLYVRRSSQWSRVVDHVVGIAALLPAA